MTKSQDQWLFLLCLIYNKKKTLILTILTANWSAISTRIQFGLKFEEQQILTWAHC